MSNKRDLWNLTGRISTQTKLDILEKVFGMWLTIWNKQTWISKEWYILDLFAGRGKYNDGSYGSPLIFLDIINKKLSANNLRKDIKIYFHFIEKDMNNYNLLEQNINEFINKHTPLNTVIKINLYNDDCNIVVEEIIKKFRNSPKNPLYVLIDPTGLQIKRNTMDLIVNLKNSKDIMFNYILEGVRRTSGVAKKAERGEMLTEKEIKTINTLKDFIGNNVNLIGDDIELLTEFVNSCFASKGLHIVGFDIKYPDRNDTLYYLLYACKKPNIARIVKDIYAKKKENLQGKTLFGGKNYYKDTLFKYPPSIGVIKKKSLLYKTKVEYGDWTINHLLGCKHGCKYPCYAMMMAKKFGWIKDYNDWLNPRIVENSLELLENEIPKYRDKISFVHLSFMTDPFMYDIEKNCLIPEIKEMTMNIIRLLNKENIKVTVLTKGIYPEELLDTNQFLQTNEYGITLVSLNNDFKREFEPYSASFKERISSLKKLSDNGLITWASIEPYPTPDLDSSAQNIEELLERLKFVKKIIFGKLNYNRLAYYGNSPTSKWQNNEMFYEDMAKKVIEFCQKNNIKYHIKFGTPLSKKDTLKIFG